MPKHVSSKNRVFILSGLTALLAAGSALAEPSSIKGTITDVFGSRIVVQDAASAKVLVNLGPALGEVGAIKSGDVVSIEGDLRPSGEMRATSVTLPDGRTVVAAKDDRSWMDWFTADGPKAEQATFDSTEASRILTEAGYTSVTDLRAEKSHFVAVASKDGKAYDVDVHKDGTIDADTAFTVDMAQKALADDGYMAVEGLQRDGKHFVGKAMKENVRYNVEVDNDGDVDDWVDLTPAEVLAKVTAAGYTVSGQPIAMKRHFEVLGMKNGSYYEVHVDGDGDVDEERKVEATDPKWAASIKS